MQQTPNYKLNLIETSDPFSPNALNENAEKTEAALARLDESSAGLTSRVTALEVHKIAVGSYVGNGGTQTIDLGFTPRAVYIATNYVGYGYYGLVVEGLTPIANTSTGGVALEIVENGFTAYLRSNVGVNRLNDTYVYVAFG